MICAGLYWPVANRMCQDGIGMIGYRVEELNPLLHVLSPFFCSAWLLSETASARSRSWTTLKTQVVKLSNLSSRHVMFKSFQLTFWAASLARFAGDLPLVPPGEQNQAWDH